MGSQPGFLLFLGLVNQSYREPLCHQIVALLVEINLSLSETNPGSRGKVSQSLTDHELRTITNVKLQFYVNLLKFILSVNVSGFRCVSQTFVR